MTPLHEAAQHGNNNIVVYLLDCGAGKTVRNEKGKTPYDLAIEGGHKDTAKLLK